MEADCDISSPGCRHLVLDHRDRDACLHHLPHDADSDCLKPSEDIGPQHQADASAGPQASLVIKDDTKPPGHTKAQLCMQAERLARKAFVERHFGTKKLADSDDKLAMSSHTNTASDDTKEDWLHLSRCLVEMDTIVTKMAELVLGHLDRDVCLHLLPHAADTNCDKEEKMSDCVKPLEDIAPCSAQSSRPQSLATPSPTPSSKWWSDMSDDTVGATGRPPEPGQANHLDRDGCLHLLPHAADTNCDDKEEKMSPELAEWFAIADQLVIAHRCTRTIRAWWMLAHAAPPAARQRRKRKKR